VHTLLKLHGIETLLMVGQRSNIALLYTGTKAATDLDYNVVIPIDGIAANTDYEKEYGLIHFTLLPRGAERFTFTTLGACRNILLPKTPVIPCKIRKK